mgnify:FL=1
MSYEKTVNDFLRAFERSFVGFDEVSRLAKTLQSASYTNTNYPPYNIRKVSDNKYVIEMAVAGFGKQDIEIELEEDTLRISGKHNGGSEDNFIFQGLAARNFMCTFTLNDQVEVKNASLMNGILKVFLERIIPEEKKKRKIEISDEPETVGYVNYPDATTKQLLTEAEIEQTHGKLM